MGCRDDSSFFILQGNLYICGIMATNKFSYHNDGAVPQKCDGEKLPDDPSGKWTEIEHLPHWDEKYYYVYTAKKYGKWVMLKALRPELRSDPVMRSMIEKEFDVRYNLAHPHIIMINDFEEVPGIGRCIITDDVYGNSLRYLIDHGEVTEAVVRKITSDLVDAMEYIQENHLIHHPMRPESVIFTDKINNLKLIDVGFDQLEYLSVSETGGDMAQFGQLLEETLLALPPEQQTTARHSHLMKIARECQADSCRYHSVQDLKLAINGRSSSKLLALVITFLAIMVVVLAWLHLSGRINSRVQPPLDGQEQVENTPE